MTKWYQPPGLRSVVIRFDDHEIEVPVDRVVRYEVDVERDFLDLPFGPAVTLGPPRYRVLLELGGMEDPRADPRNVTPRPPALPAPPWRLSPGELSPEVARIFGVDPEPLPLPSPAGPGRSRNPIPWRLTSRELQAATAFAEGLNGAGVGRRLGVTESSARYFLSRVYAKLLVHDRTQLAAALAGYQLRLAEAEKNLLRNR
jgi:DNA-binding CsgD family transcriptional regulator